MTFNEKISRAKELLRSSIEGAIKFIVPLIAPTSTAFDEFIQIEGRFNQIEREFNKGIITTEERGLRLNQIRDGLLSTINALSENDLRIEPIAATPGPDGGTEALLEKLRESIAELEKLKSENLALKSQDKKQRLKIIIQCDPEIDDRPSAYTCQCIILDDETGEEIEKEMPLRKEPGGIVVTIHDINPTDYVQIRIKDASREWESEYFSPQFLTQILKLV
ncbi:MAG: hypothetical protein AAGI38_19555 [Bacteroidota bacterium]